MEQEKIEILEDSRGGKFQLLRIAKITTRDAVNFEVGVSGAYDKIKRIVVSSTVIGTRIDETGAIVLILENDEDEVFHFKSIPHGKILTEIWEVVGYVPAKGDFKND